MFLCSMRHVVVDLNKEVLRRGHVLSTLQRYLGLQKVLNFQLWLKFQVGYEFPIFNYILMKDRG